MNARTPDFLEPWPSLRLISRNASLTGSLEAVLKTFPFLLLDVDIYSTSSFDSEAVGKHRSCFRFFLIKEGFRFPFHGGHFYPWRRWQTLPFPHTWEDSTMKETDFLLSQLKKSKQSGVVSITETVLFAEVTFQDPEFSVVVCWSCQKELEPYSFLCLLLDHMSTSAWVWRSSWGELWPLHVPKPCPQLSWHFPYAFLSDFEGSLPFTLLFDFFLPCSGSPCGSISISVVQVGPCLEYFGLPRSHAHLEEASIFA